jgi:hypothetical protein
MWQSSHAQSPLVAVQRPTISTGRHMSQVSLAHPSCPNLSLTSWMDRWARKHVACYVSTTNDVLCGWAISTLLATKHEMRYFITPAWQGAISVTYLHQHVTEPPAAPAIPACAPSPADDPLQVASKFLMSCGQPSDGARKGSGIYLYLVQKRAARRIQIWTVIGYLCMIDLQ